MCTKAILCYHAYISALELIVTGSDIMAQRQKDLREAQVVHFIQEHGIDYDNNVFRNANLFVLLDKIRNNFDVRFFLNILFGILCIDRSENYRSRLFVYKTVATLLGQGTYDPVMYTIRQRM